MAVLCLKPSRGFSLHSESWQSPWRPRHQSPRFWCPGPKDTFMHLNVSFWLCRVLGNPAMVRVLGEVIPPLPNADSYTVVGWPWGWQGASWGTEASESFRIMSRTIPLQDFKTECNIDYLANLQHPACSRNQGLKRGSALLSHSVIGFPLDSLPSTVLPTIFTKWDRTLPASKTPPSSQTSLSKPNAVLNSYYNSLFRLPLYPSIHPSIISSGCLCFPSQYL